MSSIKKELYNHSFEHVVKQFNIAEKSFDVESKKLAVSANEIYVAAQLVDRNGDEELAYIFYMRYITIIQALQKKSDFRSQQTELSALYGGEDCFLNALNAAEVLQKSLIARFKERDNPKRSSHVDSKILPSVTDQKNANGNKSKSPLPDESYNHSNRAFVSEKELVRIIEGGPNNVLIIDCRPEKDFNESKLKYVHCVNIPEEIIKNGISANTIWSQLSSESKALWADRSTKEKIILMDWDSDDKNVKSPIATLKNFMLHWDPYVLYKKRIWMLDGGYENFIHFYPNQTTNSQISRRPLLQFKPEVADQSSEAAVEKLHSKELQQKLDDKSNELEQLKLKYDRLQQQFKAKQAAHEQYRMDVESTMNAEIEKRIAEKEAKENEQRAQRQK